LGAASEVGPKPEERRASDATGGLKTLQQDVMVYHVKGSRDIIESQQSKLRSINS
jgi:hypothetical protein